MLRGAPDLLPRSILCLLGIFSLAFLSGCGEKATPYDRNLLRNPSFEEVDNGLPKGWHLLPFRGLDEERSVEYGVDTSVAYDGEKSFYFRAEEDTKRFLILAQEVRVKGASQVRIKGAIKVEGVRRNRGQYPQCNFLLTLFDKSHNRFQEVRFADKRTRMRMGTKDWIYEDRMYRIPRETAFITVSCILGMEGKVWFDKVSLEIPKPLPWRVIKTKSFIFHYLPEKEFPKGSVENEQMMFDRFCKLLATDFPGKIYYYFYPDSQLLRKTISIKGLHFTFKDEREIHSFWPNENHDIIHLITDIYGRPPYSVAEGIVYFLQGGWRGRSVHAVAKELLLKGRLPSLMRLLSSEQVVYLPDEISLPASASFVGYLYQVWGPKRLMQFFAAADGLDGYVSTAEAFKQVYGISIREVEGRWHEFLSVARFDEQGVEAKGGGR